MSKSENFTRELFFIKDQNVREIIKNLIEKLPDYFF